MNRKKAAAVSIGLGILFVAAIGTGFDLRKSFFQPTETSLEGADAEEIKVKTVAKDLKVPWGIEFLPGGDMLVTERGGTLRRIGSVNATYEVPSRERGESGLLGIEKHPGFSENRYIYLYHTREVEDGLRNRVVRHRLENGELSGAETVIEGLPGAPYHDGGRIEFGPEGKLYITVGDATRDSKAQDRESFHGTILRLNPDGTVPDDNPFSSPVYSYGHRNPQGLAFIENQLWATEHGNRAKDELNRIEKGANYGWPVTEGDETREGMVAPVLHSGDETWAPAGAAYAEGSIFFAGLRGESLYQAEIENGEVKSLQAHLREDFGRLRAVELHDGKLYVSTSNRDGRGDVNNGDDRIIRIDPSKLG